MNSLNGELERAKESMSVYKGKFSDIEAEVSRLRDEISGLRGENSRLKEEVEKGVEDLARALGVGYGYCYDRLKAVGVDLVGHAF